MQIDIVMLLAIAAWTIYATLIVTVGKVYARRMLHARRQMRRTRAVTAAAAQPAPGTVEGEAAA